MEDAKAVKLIEDTHNVDGIPHLWPASEEAIRKLSDVAMYEDDVIVAAYPKSGIYLNHFYLHHFPLPLSSRFLEVQSFRYYYNFKT